MTLRFGTLRSKSAMDTLPLDGGKEWFLGILLCTRKGKKMVEYALAGLDNKLFVSTYMLQLPDKDTLEKFLMDEIENRSEEV